MAPQSFPIIVCRHEDYSSAGQALASVRDAGTEVHTALIGTLAGYGGMAGTDSAGREWAKAYDEAAAIAVQTSSKLVSAFARTSDLLAAGAYNHASGEAGANPATTAPPAAPTLGVEPCLALNLPSASGASGEEPFGWGLIESAAGLAWPDGHQDQLRAAKTVWHSAAAALVDGTGPISSAVDLLGNQQSPEVSTAINTCNEMGVNADELAAAYRVIGDSCEEYAQHLDDAHHHILSELRQMLIETAAVEAAIHIGAFFTAGLTEFGNVGVAARIGWYAARIARIITELVTKAVAVARRITSIVDTTLRGMFARLNRWLERAVAKLWHPGGHTGIQLFSRGGARTNADVLENGGEVALSAESVIAYAQRAGIDLTGVDLYIVKELDEVRYLDFQDAVAVTPSELGGAQIRFGPAAFADEETLVATIAHEMAHVRQLREGRELGTSTIRGLEDEAYAAEAPALARFRGDSQ
ncbi:WXG100-like domain-containing protein [Nocardia farcinica]|uniref:WXG100-like domain-containing protein n=1 Tax=Nocardia farcinica TaxID=37329 RepID=UPI0018958569|nr:hypothetical protein [Nocardia farcinica]MBF6520928.1 hypothetical protein [Nocardia farcinica]